MIWSTVAALVSAALFAGTTNLQRVAASAVVPGAGGPLHLVRRLVRDLRWLAGSLVGVVALGLHALALGLGAVLVVQSVMALGLLLALGLEAMRERRLPRRREIGGAALVVAGVAVVVGTGRSAEGAHRAIGWVTATVCGVVVLAALAAVVRSRHQVGHRWEARMLAAAAGACFAADAVFLQQVAAPVDAVLGRPGAAPDVGAIVVGVVGFLAASAVGGVAVHRAYQVAPLRSVQPALAAAEPVTAFLLGIGVLGEGVRGGAAGFAALLAGLVAITAGILVGLAGTVPAPGRSLPAVGTATGPVQVRHPADEPVRVLVGAGPH